MFTADVYRFVVKSAGANQEEYTTLKVIEDWNAHQGEVKGKVFIPVKATDGQEVDVVIGIVGSYIFDAEFFKKSIEAGKKVILFFNAFHDVNNSMKSEVEAVEAFKKEMKPICICESYNGNAEFVNVLYKILTMIKK